MNDHLTNDIGALLGRHVLGHVEDGKVVLERGCRLVYAINVGGKV